MKPVSLLVCGAAVACAGCSAAPNGIAPQFAQSRAAQCFRSDQVYGYTSGPNGFVDLQTAQGPFRMHLGPGCPDFSWFMQTGVRPMQSSWLCERKTDVLITGTAVPGNACVVSQIQSLASGPPSAPS